MRVGLFFGSFNPVHVGHLIIAQSLLNISDLDQIWMVVSPQNPLKERATLAHEFDRFDMVRRATHYSSRIWASDIEFGLPKPSYTIDTLVYIKEKHPEHSFTLIMGEDNLVHIKKWKNWETLVKNNPIIVYPRPGVLANTQIEGTRITRVEGCPYMEISASLIRGFKKRGKSIQYLVTSEVEEFIEAKNLYC